MAGEAAKGPLVSCIIPVWNCEKYLSDAIDSILGQTYRPIELIVVDDGSTDRTSDVIARYGDKLRTVRQANSGPGAARNAGIALAQGPYIAFLDADDLWDKNKLERQVACLQTSSSHDLCVVGIQNFWIDELKAEQDTFVDHQLSQPQIGYTVCTVLVRRTVFDRIGLFDNRLNLRNDREWFVKVRTTGLKIATIPDVMVHRRIHFSNLTRRSADQSRDELFAIAKAAILRRERST
jgi:glycosyltransferase involved in cell wall biosynthesis